MNSALASALLFVFRFFFFKTSRFRVFKKFLGLKSKAISIFCYYNMFFAKVLLSNVANWSLRTLKFYPLTHTEFPPSVRLSRMLGKVQHVGREGEYHSLFFALSRLMHQVEMSRRKSKSRARFDRVCDSQGKGYSKNRFN